MKIAVAGTGYVGLSNALLLSSTMMCGQSISCKARLILINKGKSPIVDREIRRISGKERICT